ncbi:MAG: tRNA (adenosine(37)-N6)-threonylcarbamoyltransferase complex dimerization subunit type 1 TsaB [Clostridia bacterium]|jgi:tRNA threonylcarbamoyladenosine biosynthesis protein TsaB
MNVLGVDCSGDILSVGVGRALDGQGSSPATPKHPYREERGHKPAPGPGFVGVSVDAGFRHAERLMGAVDFCLSEAGLVKADVDLFACAGGPGSFTGLRIAMASIKGMAYGLGKPFVSVPSLDAMAADWAGTSPVIVPVMDAKRSHFYFGVYESGRLVSGPHDDTLERMLALASGYPEVLFVGPDAEMLDPAIQDRTGFRRAEWSRRAPIAALLTLAVRTYDRQGPAPADESPNYLRASDAEEASARKPS